MERRGLRGETFKDKVPSAQRFLKGSSRHISAKHSRSAYDKGHGKEMRKGNRKKRKMRGVRVS